MAKSARGPGKRGETHYNRKETGKDFKKSGVRKTRPARGEEEPFRRRDEGRKPSFRKAEEGSSFKPRREEDKGRKPFRREEGNEKTFGRRPSAERKDFRENAERPVRKRRDEAGGYAERKPAPRRFEDADKKPFARRHADKSDAGKAFGRKDDKPFRRKNEDARKGQKRTSFEKEEFAEWTHPGKPGKWNTEAKSGPMTLNKYLAHAGVSSRRNAADIIKQGKVQVNGKVLTEPGYRVQPKDKVTMDGKEMKPQKHFVYVLLNKPKDFITTTEDDRGRHTVMELVSGATDDRLYPVGRLDRNTTGVLLLTNDGDLAQKLSHPKYESKKIYQVSLDKDLTKRDFDKILEGVELEDGLATVDRLAYLDKKSEIGLEIHSGRNRIVRRIFEQLGYQVEKLDRVMYAGLTKKNVSRGKWRFLTEKEVIALKHFRT
jgi:23S rRNA pseudouridine2605 synthase